MSSMSMSDQRRALRAGRRTGSGRSELRANSSEVIDVETLPDPPPCIDLTSMPEVDFVDLTSANYSTPIVIQTSQSDASTGSSRRRRQRRSTRPNGISAARRRRTASGVEVLTDSESDLDELPLTPFEIPDMPTRGSTSNQSAEPVSGGEGSSAATTTGLNASVLSPEIKSISCPVCFENDKQIKRSGRRIMSTVCGHVFCDECIRASVQSQKRCPTCRKKLSHKQYHPLFL